MNTYVRTPIQDEVLVDSRLMLFVERIGLFYDHPSVQSSEERDWGYHALRLDIPIVYNPDIVVNYYSWRKLFAPCCAASSGIDQEMIDAGPWNLRDS